jgi:FdrA protein
MPLVLNRVEKGRYLDSVALMRVSRRVSGLAGVEAAALMIGTPSNRVLMREAGLLSPEGEQATPNDLVIAIRAADERAGAAAMEAARQMLLEKKRVVADEAMPHAKSIGGALDALPEANLALISVPGEFAAFEARKALERGLNALVFSDNVPLEDEVALKRLARDKGLLLMGPDCGTALIGGTPIAFANAVPRGDIGIVSASGTGLQEVSSLIARLGGGVSHGLGVGGRDLDARVGALGTLAAIAALEKDAATKSIVLISKPPAPEIAARVLEAVSRSPKPYVVCFLGLREASLPSNARFAPTLREAAALAMDKTVPWNDKTPVENPPVRGSVRALYCGGTLCAEAEIIFRNLGLKTGPGAHEFIDLGDDEHTRGRPHPMIEPELRSGPIAAALADPKVGLILADVVLGFGSHESPAQVLVQALAGSKKPVIASVTGTEGDPQGWSRQVAILRGAGVIVAPSNAHAAELAASLVRPN